MFFNIVGFKAEEDSDPYKNVSLRPSLYSSLININSRYNELMESFYDKKNLVIKSEKESFNFFNISNTAKYITERETLNNWADFGVEPRKQVAPFYFNRYFSLISKSNKNLSCLALIYSFLAIKYNIEDSKFENLTRLCTNQYNLLIKGLVKGKAYKKNYTTIDELEDNNLLISNYLNQEYVIITYNWMYWKLDISDNYIELMNEINMIIRDTDQENENYFLGYLTTSPEWKSRLVGDFSKISKSNSKVVQYLNNCILLVKLVGRKTSDFSKHELINECWFGNISFTDKLACCSVFIDGAICFNLETCLDSEIIKEISKLHNNMAKYFDSLLKNEKVNQHELDSQFVSSTTYMMKKLKNRSSVPHKFAPKRLIYDLTDELKNDIKELKVNYYKAINGINSVENISSYGSSILILKSINSEAFMQVSILAATYRYIGELMPINQRVSTRNFKNGGVESMKLNNKKSNSFALAMSLDNIPRELRIKLGYDSMREFLKSKDEIKGGSSLHTLVKTFLNLYQKKMLLEPSSIDQRIISFINENSLFNYIEKIFATSDVQQVNDEIMVMGFPPECTEGIGISFLIYRDKCKINLSSSFYSRSFLKKLSDTILEVLAEMSDLFVRKSKAIKF